MAEEHIVINEGIQVKEAQSCLLCGSEGMPLYQNLRDRLFNASGMRALMRCSNCELVWLNPRPVPDDIGKLYSGYHTHQTSSASKKSLAGLRKSVRASILRASFGYQIDGANRLVGYPLSWIGPLREIVGEGILWLRASDGKRLLDVGCGNGWFLAKMAELGWEVVGVEPDEEAARVAREKFGLKVFQGTLEEAKFPDDNFDVITMSHVIEHVHDPIGLLTECRRVLKPGGKLVVVTPNVNSLGRRVFDSYWRGWEVPRHLFLFQLQTLRTCAERAGLRILELRTTARSAHEVWTASRLIKRNGVIPGGSVQEQDPWLRLEGLAFKIIEYMLCSVQNFGEEIVLIAMK